MRLMAKAVIRIWHYAGCSTCKKALAWLAAHDLRYEAIPIVDSPPSVEALAALVAASGLPVRKFVNVSGESYRALIAERGKPALDALSDGALIGLLAADGKMIKRPLIDYRGKALVGFDAARYADFFGV